MYFAPPICMVLTISNRSLLVRPGKIIYTPSTNSKGKKDKSLLVVYTIERKNYLAKARLKKDTKINHKHLKDLV